MKEDLKQAIKELWNEYQTHLKQEADKKHTLDLQWREKHPGNFNITSADSTMHLHTDIGKFIEWLSR